MKSAAMPTRYAAEVTHFLEVMANTDDESPADATSECRRNGAQAVLHPGGQAELRVAIVDISRGGAAFRCDWSADVGTELRMDLPGADGTVVARVVRSDNGLLATAFRQEEATLRLVDKALARLGSRLAAAA